MLKQRYFSTICLGLGLLAPLTGCSSGVSQWKPESKPKVFSVARRQLAPDPVYSRLRWVFPPEPLPISQLPESSHTKLSPVIHYQVKNATLEEAAEVLASIARYRSFTTSSIAKNKISLNTLGTIDELAEQIGSKAGIKVVVDHENRDVRFLPSEAASVAEPRFYSAGADTEGKANEHRPSY